VLSSRHKFKAALLSIAVAFIGVLGVASPANAATPTFTPTNYTHEVYVAVKNGSSLVAQVWVTNAGASTWTVEVYDTSCDNIGPYWHAHEASGSGVYSYGAGGCHGDVYYTVTKSKISSTYFNWWVEWGGHNSVAFAFPN
jgi:hypothetical protein